MHKYSRKVFESAVAFEALIGLPPDAFAALVEEIRPLFDDAERKRKARPPHGLPSARGRPPALTLVDGVIVTFLFARFPLVWAVSELFGVSVPTVRRAIRRLRPLLRASSASTLLVPLGTAEGRERLVRAVRALPECADPWVWFCHMGSSCGVWVSSDGEAFDTADELDAHMRTLEVRRAAAEPEPATA
jgi:hypothetical protein